MTIKPRFLVVCHRGLNLVDDRVMLFYVAVDFRAPLLLRLLVEEMRINELNKFLKSLILKDIILLK